MPFVKELCKCIKYCGDVHWGEGFIPLCYREKMALGSRGAHVHRESHRTKTAELVGISQLWVSIKPFSLASKNPTPCPSLCQFAM